MTEYRLDRYILSKRDGSNIDPDAKYFVLRYDKSAEHGEMNRVALRVWCRNVLKDKEAETELSLLALDLLMDVDNEEEEQTNQ